MTRGIKNSIALSITVLLVWFLLSRIDLNLFRVLIGEVNPGWLFLGGCSYGVAYLFRAARFGRLLFQFPTSFGRLLSITAIHNLAVRIFPNPTGELVFLQQTRQRGIPTAPAAAAVVVARGLDFFVVSTILLIGTLALFYLGFGLNTLYLFVATGILIAEIILFGLLTFRSAICRRALGNLQKRFPGRVSAKINDSGNKFLEATGVLNRKSYLQALGYSVLLWLAMFTAYALFLYGFGVSVGLIALALGGSVQIIANAIPNIGGFGVMEAGWVAGFGLVGIPLNVSVPAAFAVDIMTLVGTLLFGLVAIALERGIFVQSPVKVQSTL